MTGQTCVSGACQCPSGKIVCSGSCVTPNACGGCGTITQTVGGACGTCGTYVCTADKTALTCNDPGTTNSCPTFCTGHPAPSGVAASDYQCLDFDKGSLPSSSVWAPVTAGSGTLSATTARFNSSPDSMVTTVTANEADSAALRWSNTGSTAISNVLVSMQIEPVTPAQVLPSSSDELDLISLDSTSTRTFLYYVENVNPTYNGLGLRWQIIGGAALGGNCVLGTTLNLNQWNSLQLNVVASGGALSITLNGASVSCPCCPSSYGFAGSNSVTVTVGAADFGLFQPSYFPWTSYFDNIQATIQR